MSKSKPLTAAQLAFAESETARNALLAVRVVGLVLLLYWSYHLIQHWQYFDIYRYQVAHDGNPLLGPAYRTVIDAFAIVAGALMLNKSKWALLPYALHFVAYLVFMLSIMGYNFDWRFYPSSALLTLLFQVLILALLLWLEAKKVLRNWPLREA